MLNKIIEFSIKNKFIIGLMTLGLILWGIWSAMQLPIDAVPDITNNQVQVITVTPTLASQEVEQFVTYPIEQSLANLPDVEEMRSISRFGLSVITIVFHDDVNVYFARQLVSEKLKEAESRMPQGVGSPELAPVSTGLGEIYQYIIRPKKGSEHKYTAMDLRTLQDWVVVRQLYGTPGVAEVNSFGGLLKQYEVAIDPSRLKALNISIPEIFTALEKNNQNTGGAYIDKSPNAYFIRGIGLVNSLEDVRNIVVKNTGTPVLVKDVANVRIGNAIRYGAATFNGKEEAVVGIVLLLKGSNSFSVVKQVKEKLETIKKTLPPDIEIEPFLDRTSLIDRAISTVEHNLAEGALIVIIVLVLFLGNFRAGLIVASAIPLSMLFALSLMNVFGVSANLMSLGAIDFGLIVDGAVIIVESVLHKLASHQGESKQLKYSQKEMDQTVEGSAKQLMNSAAFGQIIILIVYLPILSLQGIEGKMFRPMAMTVGFAIVGALLLSLTYIPMMSALFLSKNKVHKATFADKMMIWIQKRYDPLLNWAIKRKIAVVSVAGALMLIAFFIFSKMGGEFIPQLKEGDYSFNVLMPQGTSLTQSIKTSMQVERIIKSFPEVESVVGKTGSSEIPTDPMPPEMTDMIVKMRPEDEWKSKMDFIELREAIEKKLNVIPGVFVEGSQPIQMRFNELMTGVKQDVAIKIFGENMDTLASLAPKVGKIISSVQGATAPQIERTGGLPQINILLDRTKIANYGLNIEDVNTVISSAFAGKSAGVVFENERRFDMVIRLDTTFRTSIEDVGNLYVATPSGMQIPLSQIASINLKEGPAQISRESGKRRVVISFNVQGRDVESVVKDIQVKLNGMKLPQGYYLTYGGAFENLQKASARLKIAVPLALFLIYLLLFFAFNSFKQATLIFTAIPMSAIGGVAALLVRGMPFSISAGVGFIALFGVAVLNGIVLIGTFNQLEKEGVADVLKRVLVGTSLRLRPVLMTATVASLGFLPMALSTGAGGEVQKPLATVVIGGLITATFLTLVVLPLLYLLFAKKTKNLPGKGVVATAVIFLSFFGMSQKTYAQQIPVRGIDTSMRGNLQLKVYQLQLNKSQTLIGTANQLPKTGIFAENEDLRSGKNVDNPNGVLKIGLSQALEWPGVYKARRNLLEEQSKYDQLTINRSRLEIRRDIRKVYYTIWYLQERKNLYTKLDSIYTTTYQATRLKVRVGDVAGLDSIAAEARLRELESQIKQFNNDIRIQQQSLRQLTGSESDLFSEQGPLEKLPISAYAAAIESHPQIQLQQQNVAIADAGLRLQKQSRYPDFEGRFFSQRLYGIQNPYSGFSVTARIPIFTRGYRTMIKAAEIEKNVQEQQLNLERLNLNTAYLQAVQKLERSKASLTFYETTGLKQANAIVAAATLAYRSGEIGFAELSQFITQAIDIQRNYLDVLNDYNQAVIEVNYYINQ
ncbi:CusA/CzcA family heavy metal efflux RND transporter [Mucilaginibacter sp. HC2]|uniref:CusA/CzcA family heavy metal efflux RND transporter n=1 Tax=Mucilaginibacter TaxID=423349 RepID=UPI000DCD6DBA|nr:MULTISPECIES: CusA/CzcA family heavy metal efflux RND transporter [Mucilaginibacter]NHA05597.1 CusA/CzcA family heavy metal efflux RND transporter [Mucilaginibacter inviolabilis]QTE35404.1 CusA/CzcA family heavy metal efflux RND transporter [Mucilaginibacter gossypii]RAV59395.1 CusA/CzcA family heavy metal efflux RND transporter [Mucilaginibacter rubeus]